jgi:glutaredoxin
MYKIYSKPNCPFCVKAKDLLKSKNIDFQEYVLDVGQVKDSTVDYFTVPQLQALVPGVRTVPQIFEDNTLIGGFDALRLKIQPNVN